MAGGHIALSVLTVLLRVAWRTVAGIVARVVADGRDTNDLLDGLTRIGIDEIAYRKGHRYLTVVIDHDTGRLVWAAEGRNKDTLARFFTELGDDRCRSLTHVSADGAEWIHTVVREHAPDGGDLPGRVSCRDVGDESIGQGTDPHPGRRRCPGPQPDVGGPQEPGRPVPPTRRRRWRRSKRRTRRCTGRTCSKNNSAKRSGSKAGEDANC